MEYPAEQIIVSEIVNYPNILLSKDMLGWPLCWIFDGSRELVKGSNPYFSATTPGPNRNLEYYVRKKSEKGDYILLLGKTETLPRSWFSYTLIRETYSKSIDRLIENETPGNGPCGTETNSVTEKITCEQNYILRKIKPLKEKIISYYRDFDYREMILENSPHYKKYPIDPPYELYLDNDIREKKKKEFEKEYPGEFLTEFPSLGSHWLLTQKYMYRFEQSTMDIYMPAHDPEEPSIKNIPWKTLPLYRWKPIPEAECRTAFSPLDRDPAIPDSLKPDVSGP